MRKWNQILLALAMAFLLSGCAMRTVEEMYAPPRRSDAYNQLQAAMDKAMLGMEFCAPVSGENQQTVQMADVNGDGEEEYILYARANSDTPLQILIFQQDSDESCRLVQQIQSTGSAFEQVEYVDIDGQPGCEIVVGRQVSDQVLKTLSAYSFSTGEAQQILGAGYYKYLSCDLDSDGKKELMLLRTGETETDKGYAVLYRFADGEMQRSREVPLSQQGTSIKRIMTSALHGGEPAVFVASAVEDSAIITDVFALKEDMFTNISFSRESGNSVGTLRNYYVYGDDLNEDGILEMPYLITMKSAEEDPSSEQHLIRWYTLDIDGRQINKLYTYHNYVGGWYLELDSAWAPQVSVQQEGSTYTFCLWDEDYESAKQLFSIHCLTGSSRAEQAAEDGKFPLHTTENTVYAAVLAPSAGENGITKDSLVSGFHLIHQDWNTGET